MEAPRERGRASEISVGLHAFHVFKYEAGSTREGSRRNCPSTLSRLLLTVAHDVPAAPLGKRAGVLRLVPRTQDEDANRLRFALPLPRMTQP